MTKRLLSQIQSNEILMSATQPHRPNKRAKVPNPLISVDDATPLNTAQIISGETPAIGVAHHELGDGPNGLLTSGYSQYYGINRQNTDLPGHTQTFGNPFVQSLVTKAGDEAEKLHKTNNLNGREAYITWGEREAGQKKREEAEVKKTQELAAAGGQQMIGVILSEGNLEEFPTLFIEGKPDELPALCGWPLMAAIRAEMMASPPPTD